MYTPQNSIFIFTCLIFTHVCLFVVLTTEKLTMPVGGQRCSFHVNYYQDLHLLTLSAGCKAQSYVHETFQLKAAFGSIFHLTTHGCCVKYCNTTYSCQFLPRGVMELLWWPHPLKMSVCYISKVIL